MSIWIPKRFSLIVVLICTIGIFLGCRSEALDTDRSEALSTVYGDYTGYPAPIIQTDQTILPDGVSPSILLAGYGAGGIHGIIRDIDSTYGTIHRLYLGLEGDLYYRDGRALMVLEDKDALFLGKDCAYKVLDKSMLFMGYQGLMGFFEMEGEIVDPLYYFMRMDSLNIEEHMSYASRSLKNGNHLLFKTKDEKGETILYLIRGKHYVSSHYLINESAVYKMIDQIGQRVKLKGYDSLWHGWGVVFYENSEIVISN